MTLIFNYLSDYKFAAECVIKTRKKKTSERVQQGVQVHFRDHVAPNDWNSGRGGGKVFYHITEGQNLDT